jgi:hypothetical protein
MMESIKKFIDKKIIESENQTVKGGSRSQTGTWGTDDSDLYIVRSWKDKAVDRVTVRTTYDLNPFNND